ncbi:MAG TPA: hypothetical protein VIY49_33465 [Bryobacteraceae bacterium]
MHDIGYIGRRDMDGEDGEEHVILGARIMGALFGPIWADECYPHSRYWSRRMGLPVSRLCFADKLAFAMTPAWLYIPMARRTGELAEYMKRSSDRQAGDQGFTEDERILLKSQDSAEWLKGLQSYTRRWVKEHATERSDHRRRKPLSSSSPSAL